MKNKEIFRSKIDNNSNTSFLKNKNNTKKITDVGINPAGK
jgi:hypothetical protein